MVDDTTETDYRGPVEGLGPTSTLYIVQPPKHHFKRIMLVFSKPTAIKKNDR